MKLILDNGNDVINFLTSPGSFFRESPYRQTDMMMKQYLFRQHGWCTGNNYKTHMQVVLHVSRRLLPCRQLQDVADEQTERTSSSTTSSELSACKATMSVSLSTPLSLISPPNSSQSLSSDMRKPTSMFVIILLSCFSSFHVRYT